MSQQQDQGPTIKIGPKRSYTLVWDDYFVPGMTARAWGYFCRLAGKPPGWEARVWHLIREFKEGRDAAYTALNELVDLGLMNKESYLDGNLRRTRYVLAQEVLDGVPLAHRPRSAPETDSQDPESQDPGDPDPDVPGPGNRTQVSKDVVILDGGTTDPGSTAAAVATTGRLAATVVDSIGTTTRGEVGLFGVVDAEVIEDEPGEPDMDATHRRTVQTLVAAYVDVVTAKGGHCTSSILKSIGSNVKRVVREDKIPEGVLLVAVQAAASKGQRSVDGVLAAPNGPQASWDRSPAARRAMQQSWLDAASRLDEAAAARRAAGAA